MASLWSQPKTATLSVELQNVRFNLGGTLYIMLVNDKDQAVYKLTRPTSERNATFYFNNLPHGKYAVRAYHDKNNNGELDKGVFGQPVEGWGVSNNVRGFMSAPPFAQMLVSVNQNQWIGVRIDY